MILALVVEPIIMFEMVAPAPPASTPPPKVQVRKVEVESEQYFKGYAYCACIKCTGNGNGITASGRRAVQGRTIAVDKRVIKLGSVVHISVLQRDGSYAYLGKYVADDTGGNAIRGNAIDIYFETHSDAVKFGKQKLKIKVVQ